MSETRELYYTEINKPWHKTRRAQIENYVSELEQQITELKESQKQKQIIRLCQRLDKAEQQNKELKELLKQIDGNVLNEWPYEYSYYRNRVSEIINK